MRAPWPAGPPASGGSWLAPSPTPTGTGRRSNPRTAATRLGRSVTGSGGRSVLNGIKSVKNDYFSSPGGGSDPKIDPLLGARQLPAAGCAVGSGAGGRESLRFGRVRFARGWGGLGVR